MRLIVRLNNPYGFTLTEFLVAIVILMFGLMALLQSVNIAIATNGSEKKRAAAVQLADQALGRVRVMAFSTITSNGLKTTTEYPNLTKSAYAGLAFVNYSVSDKVTKFANNSTVSVYTKNVQINVSWKEKGVRKTHSIATVIANTPSR
ncbi:MAG: prepilin-type N-terminal cleavage/methylation domain-containing protein [Geobacteraceae bacterium]|nr:prepilin-type N-terminal cleavage/methylation domain-containing protein [Geobacteraceae bacterium]